jgi:hypothetical protein
MGLADWVRGLFKESRPAVPREVPAAPVLDQTTRHSHYYAFAHQFLPMAFFHSPGQFLDQSAGPEGAARFEGAWRMIGAKVGPPPVAPPTGLSREMTMLAGRRAMVVTFPRPLSMTEAFYAALVEGDGADAGPRYFTFELTMPAPEDGPSGAGVFCEWTTDRTHANRGHRSSPDPVMFRAIVERTLEAGREH